MLNLITLQLSGQKIILKHRVLILFMLNIFRVVRLLLSGIVVKLKMESRWKRDTGERMRIQVDPCDWLSEDHPIVSAIQRRLHHDFFVELGRYTFGITHYPTGVTKRFTLPISSHDFEISGIDLFIVERMHNGKTI